MRDTATIGPSRHARWRMDLTLTDPAFDRSSFAQRYRCDRCVSTCHGLALANKVLGAESYRCERGSDREEDFFVNSFCTFISFFFFLFSLELTKAFVFNNLSNHECLQWIKQILSSFLWCVTWTVVASFFWFQQSRLESARGIVLLSFTTLVAIG